MIQWLFIQAALAWAVRTVFLICLGLIRIKEDIPSVQFLFGWFSQLGFGNCLPFAGNIDYSDPSHCQKPQPDFLPGISVKIRIFDGDGYSWFECSIDPRDVIRCQENDMLMIFKKPKEYAHHRPAHVRLLWGSLNEISEPSGKRRHNRSNVIVFLASKACIFTLTGLSSLSINESKSRSCSTEHSRW